MTNKTIAVVSANALYVYIKMPFLDIPVELNYVYLEAAGVDEVCGDVITQGV